MTGNSLGLLQEAERSASFLLVANFYQSGILNLEGSIKNQRKG